MAFEIEIPDLAESDLKLIVLFERRRIVEAMLEQLVHEPGVETRNRKMLEVESAGFEF